MSRNLHTRPQRRRSVLLFLLVAAALAVPVATAAAACACRQFAHRFNRSSHAQLAFQREADSRGVSRALQAGVRRGVDDWERAGYPSESFVSWCGTNTACDELRGCLIDGGKSYLAARSAHEPARLAIDDAATNCAAAVATTP